MIINRFAAAALCLACAACASGCVSEPAASLPDNRPESAVTSAGMLPRRWMNWTTSEPGVPLDEARDKVGVPIRLPDLAAAGQLKKVVLDGTASFETGHPGLLILFESGVTLSIQHRQHEMDWLGTDMAPYTDGRKSAFETRTVDGVLVRVGEAGIQTGSHGENLVPSQVMWNEGDMGYGLTGPTPEYGVDRLITVMRSFK